jgi:pimeloyl-ACP methyl ester carboxylesterase
MGFLSKSKIEDRAIFCHIFPGFNINANGSAMKAHSPKEIDIKTRFLRIAAKQWGPSDGIPTIGLHGWLDNANTFDHVAPLLPRLNLVSIDMPGHGLSEHRPAGVRYHFGDYVDDLLAVADALEWGRFILLGHSMGGGVASLFSSAFPERVSLLIQIEGFGVVTRDPVHAPDSMRKAVLAMTKQARNGRSGYNRLEELIAARSKAGDIRLDSAETLIKRSVVCNDRGIQWTSDQRLLMPVPQYYSDDIILAFLDRIQTPVLLITGASGTLKKWPYFNSRCQAVKNLHRVELPGNHHLHLDHPESVARVINDFLERYA